MAPAGLALVQQAAQRVREREAKAERQTRLEAAQTTPERTNGRDPMQTYRHGLKALYARFGASMDVFKADYMIGVDMARKGFSPDQIGGPSSRPARSYRPARQAMKPTKQARARQRPELGLKVPLSVLPLMQDANHVQVAGVVQKINHVRAAQVLLKVRQHLSRATVLCSSCQRIARIPNFVDVAVGLVWPPPVGAVVPNLANVSLCRWRERNSLQCG